MEEKCKFQKIAGKYLMLTIFCIFLFQALRVETMYKMPADDRQHGDGNACTGLRFSPRVFRVCTV